MNLKELLSLHNQRPQQSVPDWMLGYFKRYSISFANGVTDLKTHVCWLQSRNFTIDLRLPIESEQVEAKPWADYSAQELQQLANYEGFAANSDWDGTMLSWHDTDTSTSMQLHNRWTEPAILKRVGNCMMEFCPSDAYVEDWRLQPSEPGPLIGLHLIEEREVANGAIRHRGGGLIVCGDYAGLVLGRGVEEVPYSGTLLKTVVAETVGNPHLLANLFNFETSVAQGSLEQGFSVKLSTQASRLGEQLFPLDGFEYPVPCEGGASGDLQIIRQQLTIDGKLCERLFSIDTMEPDISFAQETGFIPEAADWFERESPTLTRYTEVLL